MYSKDQAEAAANLGADILRLFDSKKADATIGCVALGSVLAATLTKHGMTREEAMNYFAIFIDEAHNKPEGQLQ